MSKTSLTDLRREGLPFTARTKSGRPNTYDTAAVIRWLAERAKGDDLNAEKTRLTREQADKTALEKIKLRAELVPTGIVEAAWGQMLALFEKRLNKLPGELAKALAGARERSEYSQILRAGVHRCLTDMSRMELPKDGEL